MGEFLHGSRQNSDRNQNLHQSNQAQNIGLEQKPVQKEEKEVEKETFAESSAAETLQRKWDGDEGGEDKNKSRGPLPQMQEEEEAPVQRYGPVPLMSSETEVPVQRYGPVPVQLLESEEEPVQRKGPVPTMNQTEEVSQNNYASSSPGKIPFLIQRKMESSFGADFSDVNIHKDSSQSKELNAYAHTQGNDIHFAPGMYNPESQKGQELLGHELTHVVQQREGRVQPTVQKKGVNINDDKGLEKEADEMGEKAAKGEEVKTKDTGGESLNAPVDLIQRFEAPGHEAAERRALTEARADGQQFTNEEASMTYFGNWMRDMNQVMVPAFADAIGNDGAFALIKILALKKFGREINPELFGYYIPSEHIDNPAGQLPGADYFTSAPTVSPDLNNPNEKDRFNTQDYPARPSQYVTPQENTDPQTGTVLGANIFSVDDSGVMAYIRRTNVHVEKRLELAALKGRSSEGLVHFGAAMHAVEDLFAHSNYVEIALNKILQENPPVKDDGSPGLLPELKGADRQVQTLSAKTPEGRPSLVTGTFTSLDTLESVGSEGVKMLRMGLAPAGSAEERKAQEALVSASLKKMDTLKSNPALRAKMVKAIEEAKIPVISGLGKGNIDTVVKSGNVSDLYELIREINKYVPVLDILAPVHNAIVATINTTVLKPTSDRIESQMLGVKVQDTPLYKGKKEVDEIVNSGGNKFSSMQEMTASITGEAPDAKKNLADAQKRQALLNSTPSKVLANASHSQLAKDHTNSIFFGLAFKLAVEADKKLRDKMLAVWSGSPQAKDPHVEEAKAFREEEAKRAQDDSFFSPVKNMFATEANDDVKTSETRSKQDGESLKYGKEVYNAGKKPGQEYDLQEIRNDSANRILAISATIRGIANAPGSASQSIGDLKKTMGNNKIDNAEANKVLDKSMAVTGNASVNLNQQQLTIKLLQCADTFDKNATMVRSADTLAKREVAFNEFNKTKLMLLELLKALISNKDTKGFIGATAAGSLIIMLDREAAILAPAYTTEQLNMLNDPNPSKALPKSTIVLPPLSRVDALPVNDTKKQAIKDLLQTSREIIDHPYDSSWWKQHVINFINQHHDQILEEIKARNAGYVNFGGEHQH
ncbi:MAG: DUF4157 domain-containing protein [Sporocytophaga sp.]|uniref:eCIS core domain-containing protein n=1 Tax=Sporocytophaga sp. TaxID=2231183 RepID=UPI001AFE04E3|nr:DUF4157 domain-containing protein [Sporocytophaga sp.]MBO9698569.1 DUF4157 domain-containing protein [Sporocytophaga sp.]